MSIKLMPKFRKHAIGAAEPAAPKAKKAAATNAPIQISVGKRGAKKWRKGNGPWQYGEPPKPDKPAKKASAEMKDPVLRKDHSEPPKESVKGSASKGSSSGLMAKMKVTKQTPPEDGKGTVGSKPTIDPTHRALRSPVVDGNTTFTHVGPSSNPALGAFALHGTRARPGYGAGYAVEKTLFLERTDAAGRADRALLEKHHPGFLKEHNIIDPIAAAKLKEVPGSFVAGMKKTPGSVTHHEEVQKFLQRIPSDAHPEVAAYLNKKATKMSEAVRKNEEAYAKASKEDRSAWSPKPGAQTTKWIQTMLEQARRQASEAQRLFKAGNPTARSYLD